MKKLISILLAAGVAMPVFAQFYRTNNADTDWSNLENWTTDAEGTVPATMCNGIWATPLSEQRLLLREIWAISLLTG